MRSVLIVLLVILGLSSARANTTYVYSGGPFGYGNGADATNFGSHMTGSVTFDFDTTSVTGTFLVDFNEGITDLELTAGIYTAHNIFWPTSSFDLTSGKISGWHLTTGTGGVSCLSLSCYIDSSNDGFFGPADIIGQECSQFFCPNGPANARTFTIGTWMLAAPVPAPVLGAGLPGLIMACAGLLGWRRRKLLH